MGRLESCEQGFGNSENVSTGFDDGQGAFEGEERDILGDLLDAAAHYPDLTPEQEQAYGSVAYPYYQLKDERKALLRERSIRRRIEAEVEAKGSRRLTKKQQAVITNQIQARLAVIKRKKEELALKRSALRVGEGGQETKEQKKLAENLAFLTREEESLKSEIQQLKQTSELRGTRRQEATLIKKRLEKEMRPLATAAEAARDMLVQSNIRFLVTVARQFGHQFGLETAVSRGHSGLIRAAEKFDPYKGVKFHSYAGIWIRKEISGGNDEHTERVISVSREMREDLGPVRKTETTLYNLLGRKATDEEIAVWLTLMKTVFTNASGSVDHKKIAAEGTDRLKKGVASRRKVKEKAAKKALLKEEKRIRSLRNIDAITKPVDGVLENDDGTATDLVDLQSDARNEDEVEAAMTISLVRKERRKLIDKLFRKAGLDRNEILVLTERFGLSMLAYDKDKAFIEIAPHVIKKRTGESGVSRHYVELVYDSAIEKIQRYVADEPALRELCELLK